MIRTKKRKIKRTKKPVRDKWWIGMEYLPNEFGLVKGPYTEEQAYHININHHHCILLNRGPDWFLMYRKNTGVWKRVKRKRINLGPQKRTYNKKKKHGTKIRRQRFNAKR